MSTIHNIGIAAIRVVKAPERIRTVLGSCVGVALYDTAARLGGMAHVILPCSGEGTGDPGKFADTAVDALLKATLEAGAIRGRIAAKVAGGACMFGGGALVRLGDRNTVAVRERLKSHQIPILAEDCGGEKGRKITLDPATGTLEVQIIGQSARSI